MVHENRNIRSENISPNYATRGLFLLNLTKTSKADRQTDGRHLQRTGKPERIGTCGIGSLPQFLEYKFLTLFQFGGADMCHPHLLFFLYSDVPACREPSFNIVSSHDKEISMGKLSEKIEFQIPKSYRFHKIYF